MSWCYAHARYDACEDAPRVPREFPPIENFLHDIKDLQEAYRILESIWLESDPYVGGQISKESLDKMRRFFKFDDSE